MNNRIRVIAAAGVFMLFCISLDAAEHRLGLSPLEIGLGASPNLNLNFGSNIPVELFSARVFTDWVPSLFLLGLEGNLRAYMDPTAVLGSFLLRAGIQNLIVFKFGYSFPFGSLPQGRDWDNNLTEYAPNAELFNSLGLEFTFFSLKLGPILLKFNIDYLGIQAREIPNNDASSLQSITVSGYGSFYTGKKLHAPRFGLYNIFGVPIW